MTIMPMPYAIHVTSDWLFSGVYASCPNAIAEPNTSSGAKKYPTGFGVIETVLLIFTARTPFHSPSLYTDGPDQMVQNSFYRFAGRAWGSIALFLVYFRR